jgi:hypothetical protein
VSNWDTLAITDLLLSRGYNGMSAAFSGGVLMRAFFTVCCILLLGQSGRATTLEKLSIEDMSAKSTSIIRGRVQDCSGLSRGSLIYTRCDVSVLETWKGTVSAKMDVVVPGGTARGLTQTFTGSPKLVPGDEYVLFLWTGKSGLTHLIGLSQGVFSVKPSTDGSAKALRAAASAPMVDSLGAAVPDAPLDISINELKARVLRELARDAR